jgi:YbgC/YbaW family acyl-CoA thioester hydrolase
MLYFAAGELDHGGVAVTASHNPKEYTGLKIVRGGELPVGGESGLLEIRDRAVALSDTSQGLTPGHVERYDIWEQYVERVLSFVDLEAIKPLKIVIDAANGMGGVMLPPVQERLPQVEAVRCFFEPDGTFNHAPNPLSSRTASSSPQRGGGGSPRSTASPTAVVDDSGESFRRLRTAPSELVLEGTGRKRPSTMRASRAVPETIERAGGIPLMNRVGHAYIKHRMREEAATFGGEVSGHYYFRDFTADSGVVPFLLMLELSRRSQKLRRSSDLRDLLHHRRAEHARPDAALAAGVEERFDRKAGSATSTESCRRRGLDMNVRPEHRAARASTPRLGRGADGVEARRSPRGDPFVTVELGHVTDRKSPFKYASFTRVGFSDTDAQGIVYYGRYLPYFDSARVEYHRHLDLLETQPDGESEFVMRANTIEYLAPARFDDLIEVFVRTARIGRTSVTYECAAYDEDDVLMVTAQQTLVLVDLAERKACPIPKSPETISAERPEA